MKLITLLFLVIFSANSCAMSGKSAPIPRKTINKMWRYCEPGEVENWQGRVCNRTCLKKRRKCKKPSDFTTIVKDPYNVKEDHLFFINGNHIIITEEQFKGSM